MMQIRVTKPMVDCWFLGHLANRRIQLASCGLLDDPWNGALA